MERAQTHAPTMPTTYRPSGGYYRRAIRAARTYSQLLDLALLLVRETEFLRTWARSNGLQPPRFDITETEDQDTQTNVVPISALISHSPERDGEAPDALSERRCL